MPYTKLQAAERISLTIKEMTCTDQFDSLYISSFHFLTCCYMTHKPTPLLDAAKMAYYFVTETGLRWTRSSDNKIDCLNFLASIAEEGKRLTHE